MRFQSAEHDKALFSARAEGDFRWLDPAVSLIEEDKLASTRLQDGRGRHNQRPPHRSPHVHVHKHARLQLEAGVRNHKSYANRARRKVHLRQDLVDATSKDFAGISIHRDLRAISRLEAANIDLKNLRVDPDLREIGHSVKSR